MHTTIPTMARVSIGKMDRYIGIRSGLLSFTSIVSNPISNPNIYYVCVVFVYAECFIVRGLRGVLCAMICPLILTHDPYREPIGNF